ncbi:hypothetical protein MVLG_03061 [Microbotryum lychnidis-dioicae p1A1 Lamole]|uniref:Uncharacterized protein n=1 Tax=Microbotryum lychnidis-dioicae (strain p1A1 Lamole / MvSl-1064) TaxID=683840 RepID=U5H721_USTV1|nr:hypothetical protein MVLG_03061 [Microbotryum lychnidis-dioicae p1A1 Lamole]|eukprot:KDE06564.1 hypothetical protein MVLG_03061 [Microbotryum lychnidis-dioicae p1A1 Lamole]
MTARLQHAQAGYTHPTTIADSPQLAAPIRSSSPHRRPRSGMTMETLTEHACSSRRESDAGGSTSSSPRRGSSRSNSAPPVSPQCQKHSCDPNKTPPQRQSPASSAFSSPTSVAGSHWAGFGHSRTTTATSLPQPTTASADTTECTRLFGSIHVDEYRPATVVDSIRSLAIVILDVVKSLENHYKGKRTHGNIRDVNVVVDENGRGVLLERDPVVLSIWDDPLYKLARERLYDDCDEDEDRNEAEDKVDDEDENEDKNEDEEEEDVSNYAGDAFLTRRQLVVHELGPLPVCPWHDIEALTYVACWVTFVWAREQTEDPELNALELSNWRDWRCIDYALMSKDHALRRPERSLKTFIQPFEKKWPGFVEFIWILRSYCGLGMDYETSMLGKEELELERRWADGLLRHVDRGSRILHRQLCEKLWIQNLGQGFIIMQKSDMNFTVDQEGRGVLLDRELSFVHEPPSSYQ